MEWKSLAGALALSFLLFGTAPNPAVGNDAHRQHVRAARKVGILLVGFGTSEASAQVSFDTLLRKTAAAYPGIDVRWAYTSHIIRAKLADQGKRLDSPAVALARMLDERFTHVAVQSLHTISGAEYHELQRTVSGFNAMGAFERIVLGDPLLATQADMQRTVSALIDVLPRERKPDEAVVLMGHGTHHPANAFYAALMFQLQREDPNIFVATVEGYPDIELVKSLLLEKQIKKVFLMPLMSVAGEHAKNDMAGDEAHSWKTVLTRAGIQCLPVMKGMAEYDGLADIWVGHIGPMMAQFGLAR